MLYKISERTKKIAKSLGLDIRPSTKKSKKIDVFTPQGVFSIGARNYPDYHEYIEKKGKEYADKRREMYYSRHQKDINAKKGNGFYSWILLWN